jgi:hypothetical protein
MNRYLVAVMAVVGCLPVAAQHLWWDLGGQREANCIYGEVTVLATQPTTYYCGANWHPGEPAGGYCGIQHNGAAERRTIFSIWDTATNLHPQTVFAATDVVRNRFGGEGEGAHTHLAWNWRTNEVFQFFAVKQPGGMSNTTDARYFIFDPSAKKWRHLATINSPVGGHRGVETFGGGLNSFLENFSGKNKTAPRLALYRLWLGSGAENLKCLTRAGGDGTWGTLQDNYFLASGDTNELSAVFARFEPGCGRPTFGGRGVRLASLSNRPLPADLKADLAELVRRPDVP